MEGCTCPLHTKGGHIMNEWLAHLYLLSTTKITTGPEGGHATINQKGLTI